MITQIEDEQTGETMEGRLCDRQAEILKRLALAARLYRSTDGCLYAEFPAGDRHEVAELKSVKFRNWLIDAYFNEQRHLPSIWMVRRVIRGLEARARYGESNSSVFVRVGRKAGVESEASACYLDLGDASGRAIRMHEDGWVLVGRPGVFFRRPQGSLALPIPRYDGSIDLLRPYVNLCEPDFRLLIAWMTAALRPVGPYPILVLRGEPGSGKSTVAKLIRRLIDPQVCSLLPQPRSTREFVSSAANGWLLAYDNVHVIRDWLSDSLCRLADGGGFSTGSRLSGEESSVIQAQRPVVLNGIKDFVRRSELSDRCVFLHLPPIDPTSRRAEQEYWASFEYDSPRILGGLLDAVAGGLRELPSLELAGVPRMADFAYWAEAVSRGLGWGSGILLSLYGENRSVATDEVLIRSAVGTAVVKLARGLKRWSGTHADLRESLKTIVGAQGVANHGWPKTAAAFSKELRQISDRLRAQGIAISAEGKFDQRIITIALADGPETTQSDITPVRTRKDGLSEGAGTTGSGRFSTLMSG